MRGTLTQLQVVHALVLRETKTRFGESQLGYLWALAQPLMWMSMFAAMYHLLGRSAPAGMSMVGFLATGIVSYSLFRETCSRCLSAINANKALLYYPQVRPLDLVAARAVLETATQLTVMGLLMGGLAVYEGKFSVDSVLQIALGLGLAAGLGVSLGLVLCGLGVFNRGVERLAPAILRPMFWLSSIFHTVESVPNPLRDILLLNPVTHAIELVRDGWFPGYYARHADPWYPGVWILVLLFFGLSLERVARRSIELA